MCGLCAVCDVQLLAMYTEDAGGKGDVDPFDDVELEKRMDAALAELRLLLQNLQV